MTAPGSGTLGSAIIRVSADVTRFARGVQMAVQRELSRISWARFEAASRRAGQRAAQGLSESFRNGMKGIGGILAKMGPSLLKVGKYALIAGSALKAMSTLGPALGGLLTIIGAIAATLPALAVTALLVTKTMTLAFKGVGEAMKAAAEGDAAALDAAMKDLTPSAQSFVKEVAKIAPQFKKLQKDVQESFFKPFKGAFTEALNPGTFSALRTAMTGIADSFGRAGAGVAKMIGEAGKSGQLASIFAPLERAVERIVLLAPGLTQLFLGFADHAAPIIESFANLLSTKLGGFFDKANAWVAEGGLATFFETAGQVAGVLLNVVGDLARIFKSLFSALTVDGSGALGVVGTLIDELATFLESAEGSSLLTTIGQGLRSLTEIISGFLLPLLPVAAKLLSAVFKPVAALLTRLVPRISALALAFANLLMPVIDELAPVFVELGAQLGNVLVPILEILTEHFIKMSPIALELAKVLGPVLVLFIKQLGVALVDMLPLLENWAKVLQHSGPLFTVLAYLVGAALLVLTGLVFVIGKVGAALAWLQEKVGSFVLDRGWDLLLDLFTLTPKVFLAAVNWIITGWTWVINATKDAWDAVTSTVSGGIEKVAGFMSALPGRIAALAGSFFNAAASLGAAIGRGLSNVGNFASDIGGKIVGTIKSGINAVIGSINRGIAQIDAFLPGSLPRMSFFERGGIVDEPTLAMMGEKGKREVVLPLTDKARTLALAQESGLVDMLRASGAVGGVGNVQVNVTAILDGFGVIRVVDQRVDVKMNEQGRELTAGVRGL